MDGYNTMANPYLTTSLPLNHAVSAEEYMSMLQTVGGLPEQHNGYSSTPYDGHGHFPSMTVPMPVDTGRPFGNSYEDFYPEQPPGIEATAPDQPPPGDTSVDRDHELLSFRQPSQDFVLLDYSLRRTTVSLTARLHGMFFMAEPPPTQEPSPQTTFPELTCYRRNLFQISGSISLPRNLRYLLTDTGEQIPILSQELQISSTESVEGHPVKLISVPWKTPASNSLPVPGPEDKSEKEPSTIPLDLLSNQEGDADFATFPIAWKRLQFRIATANNGRRRELQQHFLVRIKLLATLSTGAQVSIAEAKSNAIIVRGRSPRNFQQRKEQPVGGEKCTGRRQSIQIPQSTMTRRTISAESITPNKSPLKRERESEETGYTAFDYNLNNHTTTTHASATIPAISTPTLPSSKSTTTSISPPPPPPPSSGADPISPALAIPDSTAFRRPSTPSMRPSKVIRTSNSARAARPAPYKRPSLPTIPTSKALFDSQTMDKPTSTSLDTAQSLYDYFPIGVGQWMQPVDGLYRPQIAQHVPVAVNGAIAAVQGIPPAPSCLDGNHTTQRYYNEAQVVAPSVSGVATTLAS